MQFPRRPIADRLRHPARAAVAIVVLAACHAAGEPGEVVVVEEPGAPPAGAVPVCLQGDPFVADGRLSVRDAAPGDARQIGALRWDRHDECERFVLDLLDEDGSPAERAGRVTAEVLRSLGVVRITLQDIPTGNHDATDISPDGRLVRSAFVVTSPDGGSLYVDVHLAGEAEAFVTTLDDPARVVVDLRPGGGALPQASPMHPRVVVLEPRPGAATYPLTVTGYARTFEANVVVRLERGGEDLLEDFTTSTGWLDAWGHYAFTIEDGPEGDVILHVGEYSARDGSWEGVEIPLRME
jgi:hypothetical protein